MSPTVVITGATGGIGLEVAKKFRHAGYNVAGIARREPDSQDEFFCLPDVRFFECDVGDMEAVRLTGGRILDQFPTIDVLVHGAGMNVRVPFFSMRDSDWNRSINTNLSGVFELTRVLGIRMKGQERASIVIIGSVLGVKADSVSVAYGVSKGALISLTRYLAKELAPTVNVNCVAPGFVDTAWHSDKSPEKVRDIISRIPLGRFGEPGEVADLVYFLAKAGRYVTGETIVVDGGYNL